MNGTRIIEIINNFARLLTYFKLLHTRQLQLNQSSSHFAVYTPPWYPPTLSNVIIATKKKQLQKEGKLHNNIVLCEKCFKPQSTNSTYKVV